MSKKGPRKGVQNFVAFGGGLFVVQGGLTRVTCDIEVVREHIACRLLGK
jgi:hypothetical protein